MRLISLMPRLIYPQERALVSIDYEAVWCLELVWILWRRKKKSLSPDGTENLDLPAHSLLTILTMLLQLQIKLLSY